MMNDTLFKEIKHYQKYPEMLPWKGPNYGENYPKILFIGESHYLLKESSIHLNPDIWYNGNSSLLSKDEIDHINTREIQKKHFKSNSIWYQPAYILTKLGITPPGLSENVFDHFCFYNFFQRPANNGKGFHPQKVDINISNIVFEQVIKILNPDLTIVLSKLVFNNIIPSNKNKIDLEYTCHPSSIWWNRKAKTFAIGPDKEKISGKERLEIILKKRFHL